MRIMAVHSALGARAILVACALGVSACGFDDSTPLAVATGASGTGGSAGSGAMTVGTGGRGTAGGQGTGPAAGTAGSIGAAGAAGSTSSAGGAAGTNQGSGGADVDAGRMDAAVRDVYVAERPPGAPGMLVHVVNGCSFDLWVHAAGKEAVLTPDNTHLSPGGAQDYIAPDPWTAARVTAYLATPPANEIDKAEITFINRIINYNLTYVDWVGLPIEMVSIGTGSDCKAVGCYLPESSVLSGCPEGLLSGKKCLSAGSYCSTAANQATPFCHALDPKIALCAQDAKYSGCSAAAGATTPQVYGCSGFFGGSPKWCSALNRGVLDDPDSPTSAPYYMTAPFNGYAAWVHSVCPGIYSFPYDDYGHANESGFHACGGGTQLNVTFCPSG
jgi:hypothetical protein